MGVNGEAFQLGAVYKKLSFFTTSHVRICINTASRMRIRIRYLQVMRPMSDCGMKKN